MIRHVFKWALRTGGGPQKLGLYDGYQVLSVQMQGGTLCLWALVDTDAPAVNLDILVIATGHNCLETFAKYLGTVQDGPYVWHVFARIPKE